jgi:hypothetical protein
MPLVPPTKRATIFGRFSLSAAFQLRTSCRLNAAFHCHSFCAKLVTIGWRNEICNTEQIHLASGLDRKYSCPRNPKTLTSHGILSVPSRVIHPNELIITERILKNYLRKRRLHIKLVSWLEAWIELYTGRFFQRTSSSTFRAEYWTSRRWIRWNGIIDYFTTSATEMEYAEAVAEA